MRVSLAFLCALILAVGCGPSLRAKAGDGAALKAKAAAIRKGMTKAEVRQTIGDPDLEVDGGDGFFYQHEKNGDDILMLEFEEDRLISISGMVDYKKL